LRGTGGFLHQCRADPAGSEDGGLVSRPESFAHAVSNPRGSPVAYIIRAYYVSNDGSRIEGEQDFRDGLKWGMKRLVYASGAPEEEAELVEGVYHGRVRKWHESGGLASEEIFGFGILLDGKYWDEAGRAVKEFHRPDQDPAREVIRNAATVLEEREQSRGASGQPDTDE
jgi:hypothetical protein